MSILSSGRWLNQGLYSSEILSLPVHLRDFPVIKETLYNISVSDEGPQSLSSVSTTELVWGQQEAVIALFGVGCLFRFLTWISMLLTKYSQGQTRRSQFKFLVTSWLGHFRLFHVAVEANEEDIDGHVSFRRDNLRTVLNANPRWDHVRAEVRRRHRQQGDQTGKDDDTQKTKLDGEPVTNRSSPQSDHTVVHVQQA